MWEDRIRHVLESSIGHTQKKKENLLYLKVNCRAFEKKKNPEIKYFEALSQQGVL